MSNALATLLLLNSLMPIFVMLRILPDYLNAVRRLIRNIDHTIQVLPATLVNVINPLQIFRERLIDLRQAFLVLEETMHSQLTEYRSGLLTGLNADDRQELDAAIHANEWGVPFTADATHPEYRLAVTSPNSPNSPVSYHTPSSTPEPMNNAPTGSWPLTSLPSEIPALGVFPLHSCSSLRIPRSFRPNANYTGQITYNSRSFPYWVQGPPNAPVFFTLVGEEYVTAGSKKELGRLMTDNHLI